ncbi:hypothetical protein MAPG_12098 [Magnaporthiopsis poae ATCC 64411]|uniref:CWH43-like N-terminal domain-containing protein n=1 Tax=Magnaporthiopsis poae (strain ATCC 64411 / 73-15) TaxID=644358 RepID=A0A0C4EGU3_MAGP6|nr:hypothetical protein MAPG_12098 [Magnaporthiopsis poae ATCC 64411]
MIRLSYWILPIISGTVWLGTLLGLLLHWIVGTNRTFYPSMSEDQYIAYISDVGASELKPLFVTGCVITSVFLDAGFLADRWLRHKGRLVPNISLTEKVLSALTVFFALVGTAGLILLSVFDTLHYSMLHRIFLALFMGGYALSAVFICWEYQRLGQNREHRILRVSFWIKLAFVITEVLLSVGFGVALRTRNQNSGAVLEWVIAFIFTLYIFSFFVDLYPAVYTGRRGVGAHRRHGPSDAFRTKGMPETTHQSSSSMSQRRPIDEESGRPDSLPMRNGGGNGEYRTAARTYENGTAPMPRPPPQDF